MEEHLEWVQWEVLREHSVEELAQTSVQIQD